MPVTMICPNLTCRKTIVAPDGARGRLMRCAHCSQVFMVPTRESVAPQDSSPDDANSGNPGNKRR